MERILGVNLSGWFIPEPWVTPSLYAATGASNAAELQEAMGTAAYNERMRRHYETFVSEDDFRRMAQIGLAAGYGALNARQTQAVHGIGVIADEKEPHSVTPA